MLRAQNLLASLREFDLERLDLLVAVLLGAIGLVMMAGTRHPLPGMALGALAAACVATRRRAPVASVLVVALATVLLALGDPGLNQTTQGIVAALCFYSLGRSGEGRAKPLVDLALLGVGAAAVASTPQPTALDIGGTWASFILLPYLAGRAVESRRGLTRELDANALRARHEQEASARSAAADERTRIARELHDVIAHSLSVMVIQTVAAHEVAASDPAAARGAMSTVQLAGREALLEMRRMIGVLRHGDVELAGSAAPGLDQLDLLAQRARLRGPPGRAERSAARAGRCPKRSTWSHSGSSRRPSPTRSSMPARRAPW